MTARTHLYLSSLLWDGLWIIQQPVCRQMANEEPVLYVERFVSVFTVFRYPRLWKQLFAWMWGGRQVTPGLRVLAPLPLWHLGHRFPRLFRLEFAIQRRWILFWANRQPSGERILWVDNPLYECAVGRMEERHAVYHVADEMAAFPTSHRVTVERLERRLLERVDLCFAAAEQLAIDKRRWNRHVHTIWNAIDAGVFEQAGPSPPSQSSVADLPGPRVAFVGVLDTWVDIELLALAARRLPHIHFLVVGPSRVDTSLLRGEANVRMLGPLDRSEIPGLLGRCSASLVPFRKNRLTERILPLKVFEALAAGALPICTAFSGDLEHLAREGYALVADSPEQFAVAVEQATSEDSAAYRERLMRFGRAQTWQARWRQMKTILDGFAAPLDMESLDR